ncbi:MAG: hypothetical protein WC781_01320 [Candidatus Pacearchaeota archaeon]|jgi:hypothetical protein
MIKKVVVFGVFVLFLMLNISLICASSLTVSSQPVVSTIINDHDKPLIFDVRITNNAGASTFQIYSFEQFRIEPSEVELKTGETKTVKVEFYPTGSMRENTGYITIPVYIKNKAINEQGELSKIVVKLVSFSEAFDIGGENINLNSSEIKVYFYNREDATYENIDATFSSAFFDDTKRSISLKPYQKYELTIPINYGKIKKLIAGTYSITSNINLDGKSVTLSGYIKILEKSGLTVSQQASGLIIRNDIIEKTNEGNIPLVAEINVRKNIISRLFTTFSLEPNRVERSGFFIDYVWQKELNPDEKIKVNVTTNWIFPFLLLIAFIVIVILINAYIRQNLVITKKVGFVRTKTNDFALRVTVHVKARKFMEKVVIYDRLPGIAKLYERFGEPPTKFSAESGLMQWNIPYLSPGEERVFSYVFYSKINVVGKFELPSSTGVYEMQGKMHETHSNRAFFINEPKKASKHDEFS